MTGIAVTILAALFLMRREGVSGKGDEERLFAENLHNQFAPPCPCIEIEHDNLLPRSQQECSIGEWNDDRWTLELAPKMAVPVIFSGIARVVLQARIHGNQAIPKRFCVGPDTGLILNDHDGCSGVPDKNGDDAGRQPGTLQCLLNVGGNIFDLGRSFHIEADRNVGYRHGNSPDASARRNCFSLTVSAVPRASFKI